MKLKSFIDPGSLLERAMGAYFRYSPDAPQPCKYSSCIEQHDGLTYAVLRNVNGVLRVYRIRNTGHLKHLRRWPVTLNS